MCDTHRLPGVTYGLLMDADPAAVLLAMLLALRAVVVVGVAAPRRGESYGHADIFESLAESHIPPASSITTSAPASQRTLAAMPPPAPEPTMHTS